MLLHGHANGPVWVNQCQTAPTFFRLRQTNRAGNPLTEVFLGEKKSASSKARLPRRRKKRGFVIALKRHVQGGVEALLNGPQAHRGRSGDFADLVVEQLLSHPVHATAVSPAWWKKRGNKIGSDGIFGASCVCISLLRRPRPRKQPPWVENGGTQHRIHDTTTKHNTYKLCTHASAFYYSSST